MDKPQRDKGDWYLFPTINLEWLNPRTGLDVPRYVDDLLDTMEEINSNALVYTYDCGGRPLYDSAVARKDEHIGEHDLMALLREGTRRRGQRLVIAFFGLPNVYAGQTYPQWRARYEDGRHVESYYLVVCPNSPYGDYLAQLVGEAASRYEPDGVYLEGVLLQPGLCYCGYCQEKFQREYGRPLPSGSAEELLADRDYNAYRQDSALGLVRRVRQALDRVAPGVVFMCTAYHPSDANLRELARYADVLSMERQWGYVGLSPLDLPLWELGLHTQMVRAEGGKPVYSSIFIDKQVDFDYAARSPDHMRLNFMGVLQHGATVQVHIQNHYEVDRTTVPVMAELYAAELALRPYLLNAEIVGEAALLDWADPVDVSRRFGFEGPVVPAGPHAMGGARPGTYLDDSFRGYYRALLEHHVPTRVVTVEDVEAGSLDQYGVLVLANAERLDDALQDRIRAYVEAGGGLVMTYRTGFRDEAGHPRPRPGLAALAGVRDLGGEITNPSPQAFIPYRMTLPQTYYRVTSEEAAWAALNGQLLSFMGSYVEAAAEPDAVQIAQVLDYDYGRMHPHHTAVGWYPAEPIRPLIVGRRVGRGRAVYLGAELDGASLRFGDPTALAVLAAAVRWAAGGEGLLRTNAPPSVEITLHRRYDGSGRCVVLTNQTTNQHYPDPIRYVVPIPGVEVELQVANDVAADVRTVTGQAVDWHQEGNWLSLRLERLAAYEGLLIDLEEAAS